MTDPDLLLVVRRWWWALLLGSAIAALAGFVAASKATKTYETQVRLLVGPINSSVDLDASGGLARTYADLAISEPVLQRALRAAGNPRTLETIKKNVSTSSNTITRFITVTVRDRDPAVAADLANHIGSRLRMLANTTPPRAIAALDDFSRRSELAPLSGQRRDAVVRAASRVFGASQSGRIEVVQAASAPLRPAGPPIPLMTLLAALAGFCVAAVIVYALSVRRHGPASVARDRDLSAPPVLLPGGGHGAGAVVGLEDGPESAEAYRMLASRAQLLDTNAKTRTLMVLESADGSAAATVAARLASVVAESGRTVIILDLGTTGSGVTDQLGLAGEYGYANAITELRGPSGRSRSLRGALVARGERLFVLPRGTAQLSQAFSVARLTSVLRRLDDHADVVIVAGPALTRSAALIASVGAVDKVCLVVDSQDDGDELQRVVVQLENLDGHFAGAVLRRQAPRRGREVVRA